MTMLEKLRAFGVRLGGDLRRKERLLAAIYRLLGPLKPMMWVTLGLAVFQSLWGGLILSSLGAFLQTTLVGLKDPQAAAQQAPAVVRPLVAWLTALPVDVRINAGLALIGGSMILGALIKLGVFAYNGLLSARFLFQLQQRVFSVLCRTPMTFFDTHKKGVLLQMVMHETRAHYVIVKCIVDFISNGLNAIVILAFMLLLSWKFCLLVLGVWLILLFENHLMGQRILGNSERVTESLRDVAVTTEETLGGIKHLKLLNHLGATFRIFDNHTRQAGFRDYRGNVMVQTQEVLSMAIGLLCVTGIIVWNQFFSLLPVSGLILFIYLLYRAIPLFGQLNQNLAFINVSQASAENVITFLERQESHQETGGHRTKSPLLARDLTYRHVCLDYQNRPGVLRDVSFTIRRGQTVALVGPSGAGKTSIANLLVRLYEPTAGDILIDDIPLREFTLTSLREKIGMVSQETTIFNMTVRENLLIARPDATEAQLAEAAGRAYAQDFIQMLPQGDTTLVGDRGVQLSGGQRQRLQIAQVFLKDPEILILDEATSALDSESERYIQEALRELAKDRTTLIIAHRLSTVRSADQILVIDGGHLVEQGDWNSLIASRGKFQDMVNLQSLGLVDDLLGTAHSG